MFQDPRSALIVVDMQNVFIEPTGALYVPGAEAVVRSVNELVATAVEHGRPVFYTRDVAPTELSDDVAPHQIELFAGLDVRGEVVPKGPGLGGGFSGFVLSDPADGGGPGAGGLGPLAARLRESGVASVVVAGLAGDVCVAATARDARRLGFEVTMPLAATAFVHVHPDGDAGAVAELRAAGVVVA